jgi:predicted Zn-dependent protease
VVDPNRMAELEHRMDLYQDWGVAGELGGLLLAADRLTDLVKLAQALEDHGQCEPGWLDLRLDMPERKQRAVEQLERDAAAGEWEAAECLAHLFYRDGRIERLRVRAAAGDFAAAWRAADWLVEHGQADEAIEVLLAQSARDDSDPVCGNRAATLLREADRPQEALAVLAQLADAGDWEADRRWVELLPAYAATARLRDRADAGSWPARDRLADLLVAENDIAELRRRAGDGDIHAARRLAERGDGSE